MRVIGRPGGAVDFVHLGREVLRDVRGVGGYEPVHVGLHVHLVLGLEDAQLVAGVGSLAHGDVVHGPEAVWGDPAPAVACRKGVSQDMLVSCYASSSNVVDAADVPSAKGGGEAV